MSALFISDLHIDETRPAVLAGLQRLIDAEAGAVDSLFILGDLVEVWVGDDDDGPVAAAIRETLRAASRRCRLFVMHGNRDFLIGPQFAADTGATLLDDPSVVEVDNDRILVAHGDAYCTRDSEYQRLRALFRSTAWQNEVLASSLDERRALAASLRAKSIAVNENKAANIMDVTPGSVQRALDEAETSLMVHGHTHRPGIHDLGDGRRRIVLGDWDRCGWKLRLDRGDTELSCFPLPWNKR
ncbi:MAG: UDP-2,3-diacylglucosamine diphosphatase [Gammaproteobacteria bacterium]|nr:UDP-2,3-diacylglucosamine diphosphatase [Gammaproteobacteria bacterium]